MNDTPDVVNRFFNDPMISSIGGFCDAEFYCTGIMTMQIGEELLVTLPGEGLIEGFPQCWYHGTLLWEVTLFFGRNPESSG